jgi:hypothetical protein
VAELADAEDLKSSGGDTLWVQVPLAPQVFFSRNKNRASKGAVFISAAMGRYFPRILYIPVPHLVHLPFNALRPFFMTTFSTFFISRFSLHFTQ